jgi:hypothetical protein
MRFGYTAGWMGLVGKHRVSLPAGQTFMRSFGVSAVIFLAPNNANTVMAATGASTVSFTGFSTGGGGGGTTGQPIGLLLALTYS